MTNAAPVPVLPAQLLVVLAVVGIAWSAGGVALLALSWDRSWGRSWRGSWRRPAGWCVGLTGVVTLLATALTQAGDTAAGWRLLVAAAALGLPLAVTVYPSPLWRHPVDFVALVAVVGCGVLMTWGAERPAVLGSLSLTLGVTLFGHTWWRLERSAGRERRALQWVAVTGGVVALATGLISFAFDGSPQTVLLVVLLAALPVAMWVGLALPDIVDVRELTVSAVVLVVVLLSYVSLFVGLASLLEVVSGSQRSLGTLGLLGAVVALTFHPLQVLLRGVVEELLFGKRLDPLDAASRVVGQFGGDVTLALRAVREALALPYAALRSGGEVVLASGELGTPTRSIVLEGTDSELVVGLRAGDVKLSRGDDHVLRLVAPMLEQTLRAQALADQVQQSRGALVGAVEEERRRLRRDLHDGLGPRLSGIAFTSDAARNLVRNDPGAAEEMLTSVRAETNTAIAEIRELVYAMRPPAIDELGLVPALRQRAGSLRNAGGEAIAVTVEASLPASLSAALEVAVYRIVLEALTNVARHSTSPTASVSLRELDAELVVVITDSGAGERAWTPGVGVSSMRERAAEVGGSLRAGATGDGGRVEARLPLFAATSGSEGLGDRAHVEVGDA